MFAFRLPSLCFIPCTFSSHVCYSSFIASRKCSGSWKHQFKACNHTQSSRDTRCLSQTATLKPAATTSRFKMAPRNPSKISLLQSSQPNVPNSRTSQHIAFHSLDLPRRDRPCPLLRLPTFAIEHFLRPISSLRQRATFRRLSTKACSTPSSPSGLGLSLSSRCTPYMLFRACPSYASPSATASSLEGRVLCLTRCHSCSLLNSTRSAPFRVHKRRTTLSRNIIPDVMSRGPCSCLSTCPSHLRLQTPFTNAPPFLPHQQPRVLCVHPDETYSAFFSPLMVAPPPLYSTTQ